VSRKTTDRTGLLWFSFPLRGAARVREIPGPVVPVPVPAGSVEPDQPFLADAVQGLGDEMVQAYPAPMFDPNETCRLEQFEVFDYTMTRHTRNCLAQLSGGPGSRSQGLQHPAPCGIPQGPPHRIEFVHPSFPTGE